MAKSIERDRLRGASAALFDLSRNRVVGRATRRQRQARILKWLKAHPLQCTFRLEYNNKENQWEASLWTDDWFMGAGGPSPAEAMRRLGIPLIEHLPVEFTGAFGGAA